MAALQIFTVLLIAGLILVGAEIFVPGGILGFFGGLCLLGAVIFGFIAFPGYGMYVAVAIIFLVGVAIVLWIKYFPRSDIGKRMTVAGNMSDYKATEQGLDALVGKTGTASSELRPAGFAEIDGRRIDVVTQGGMIARGTPVEVVEVEGNRVVVSRLEA